MFLCFNWFVQENAAISDSAVVSSSKAKSSSEEIGSSVSKVSTAIESNRDIVPKVYAGDATSGVDIDSVASR